MVIAPVAGSEKGFMNDKMSQGQVIDIMTYNSYSFTVLQFLKRKNRFRILKTRGQVSVSWTITLGVWSMFL